MFKLPIRQQKRHVLHIDADAFFASVEQVLNPSLKGKPVLVGGPSDKHGIVSAASYEARKFGVKSAMPIYLARRKCPDAVVVSGNFEAYRDFSRRMYRIFLEFTPDTEMASIDEAYLDITGCEEMHKLPASMIARRILFKIYRDLGLSVSCGMASSKTVAKVASSLNKPHKLTIVPFGKEKEFLAKLRLDQIPGVGPRTFENLRSFGMEKVCDLSNLSADEVVQKFGIRMIPLWKKSLGIDNSPIISVPPLPKSISKEHTFYSQNIDEKTCLSTMKKLSGIVLEKLRAHDMKAKTVFVKIRYRLDNASRVGLAGVNGAGNGKRKDIFEDFVFQQNLDLPSAVDSEVFPLIKGLFLNNYKGKIDLDYHINSCKSDYWKGGGVRLIGVGVCNLSQNYNLNLFGGREKERLFSSLDKVREIYGEESLKYGV